MKRPHNPSSLIRRSARRLYGKENPNWPQPDTWNVYKHKETERFILKTGLSILKNSKLALDAGAGDSIYQWMPSNYVSLDLYELALAHKKRAVVSDIELMPFPDSCFDLVICIGSVLNYVSAVEALNEISRVIAPGGHLYLHFETSTSFEQILKSAWGASAHLNKTINSSRVDFVWIYSPKYIFALLKRLKYTVVAIKRFHILSAFCLRFGISQKYASYFSKLDRAAFLFRYFSDDIIILAEKI
jgi:SAM-dependent methyltransferase